MPKHVVSLLEYNIFLNKLCWLTTYFSLSKTLLWMQWCTDLPAYLNIYLKFVWLSRSDLNNDSCWQMTWFGILAKGYSKSFTAVKRCYFLAWVKVGPTRKPHLHIRYTERCYVINYTRVGTLIVANIYLQLIQNRYMIRSFTVLQCSHQHCVQPVASDVEVVGYL